MRNICDVEALDFEESRENHRAGPAQSSHDALVTCRGAVANTRRCYKQADR